MPEMEQNSKRRLIRVLGILAATVILWAVLLPTSVSGNLRMDSERMIHQPETAIRQYMREGRAGLVLLLRLFGLDHWAPVKSGVLYLLFLTLSAWLFCFLLYRQTRWKKEGLYLLFFLLCVLSPIWAFHAYFVLQTAAVGFGMLLCTIVAGTDIRFLAGRKERLPVRLLREALSLLIITFSLTIYQSLMVHYLAVLCVLLFCRLLRGEKIRIRQLLPVLLRILLAALVYLVAAHLTRGGSTYSNVEKQFSWGSESVWHCLYRIVQEIGATVIMYQSRYFSLYLPAVILGLVLWRRRGGSLPLLLSLLSLLLLPFALTVLVGNVTVPRSQFALQVVTAFLPVCFLAESRKPSRVLRTALMLVLVLQAALTLRLTHTDNVRNRIDTEAAARICGELETMDTGKPLAFVGTIRMEDNSLLLEKSDVYGKSFFEWLSEEDDPGITTVPAVRLIQAWSGKEYTRCTGRLLRKAKKKAPEIPAWPEDGFVSEQKDYILIRLQ